jgi:hypothetical protein
MWHMVQNDIKVDTNSWKGQNQLTFGQKGQNFSQMNHLDGHEDHIMDPWFVV